MLAQDDTNDYEAEICAVIGKTETDIIEAGALDSVLGCIKAQSLPLAFPDLLALMASSSHACMENVQIGIVSRSFP